MTISRLSDDAVNASKVSAMLAAQVRRDLSDAGFTNSQDILEMTGRITAALIAATAMGGVALAILPSRLGS